MTYLLFPSEENGNISLQDSLLEQEPRVTYIYIYISVEGNYNMSISEFGSVCCLATRIF